MGIGSSVVVIFGASGLLAVACCVQSAREGARPVEAVTPRAAEQKRLSSTASANLVAGPSGPGDDCKKACGMLAECDAAGTRECPSRCAASRLHQRGRLHCLASRIFLIDEEGCGSMLDTYRRFAPEDDCDESQPAPPATPSDTGHVSPL